MKSHRYENRLANSRRLPSHPESLARRTGPVDRNECVRNFKGAAYIAIAAISRRIASQEVQCVVQRVKKSGIKEEPLDPRHPLLTLFREVNPFHTQYDLWFYAVSWRLCTGDSYTWKVRNGFGVPVELWPIPSQWVYAVPSSSKFISRYYIRKIFGGSDKYIPAEDIIHLMEPGVSWSNGGRFYGHAPMVAADIMIDVEVAMLKQLWHRFKNFAPPGLVFEPDKDIMANGFDEGMMAQIYSWIATQHSMAQHAYKPMVAPGGVTVKNVAMTPAEMDYGKSLEKALEYILAVFSTPKAAVGLFEAMNRANYDVAMTAWAETMLNPMLIHMGQHLTQDLAREFDEKIVIRFPRIEAQDIPQIRAFMDTALRFGVMSLEEARDLMTKTGVTNLPTMLPKDGTFPSQRSEKMPTDQFTEDNKVEESQQSNQDQTSQKRFGGNGHGEPFQAGGGSDDSEPEMPPGVVSDSRYPGGIGRRFSIPT